MEREIVANFLNKTVKIKTDTSIYTGVIKEMFSGHFTMIDKFDKLVVISYARLDEIVEVNLK